MENKMIILLEDIKSLVKTNIEGQKAFEERFERRLTNLENEMAETKTTLLAVIKEIGNVKAELASVKTELTGVKTELAGVKNDLKLLEKKVEQLKEKTSTSTRKNEMWFDLIAREYGRLRMDMEFLKEEGSLLSQNT